LRGVRKTQFSAQGPESAHADFLRIGIGSWKWSVPSTLEKTEAFMAPARAWRRDGGSASRISCRCRHGKGAQSAAMRCRTGQKRTRNRNTPTQSSKQSAGFHSAKANPERELGEAPLLQDMGRAIPGRGRTCSPFFCCRYCACIQFLTIALNSLGRLRARGRASGVRSKFEPAVSPNQHGRTLIR
jgi:hypothetical protein